VGTAADGEEALRVYGDGTAWDLVLLDLRLPGVDGLHVLKAMREQQPAARVVLITAFGTIDLAYAAMRQGAVDFLRKPFTAETLRGAVAQALVVPPRSASNPPASLFACTAMNGFRLQPGTQTSGCAAAGEKTHVLEVHGPTGETRDCRVILPGDVVRLVLQQTGGRLQEQDSATWDVLCEEVVANYVWQHSDFPDAVLRVDDMTGGLRRFIDSVLTEVH
jgi:CheY-like chemotaxis protein